jgi:hypothetical protein
MAVSLIHAHTNVKLGSRTLLVPVRIHNDGTHAVCAEGPACHVLYSAVDDQAIQKTSLPGLLLPGATHIMAAMVNVPQEPGDYPMRIWVDREEGPSSAGPITTGMLTVGATAAPGCSAPFLESTRECLVEIERRRALPDDYLDVTDGWLARSKRWIKAKLLGNFKRGYVDVLSRQQSQVNRHVLDALQQLTEACATLDHAVHGLQERIDRLEKLFEVKEGCSANLAVDRADTA